MHGWGVPTHPWLAWGDSQLRLPLIVHGLTATQRSASGIGGTRSEQSEVAEGLFNRRDLVSWTGILLGCVSWCGEAKLLFAVPNPGALGHKAVLARNPFLDFLVRGAWTKRLLLAGLTRAPMSSFLVSITHTGFGGEPGCATQASGDALKRHYSFFLSWLSCSAMKALISLVLVPSVRRFRPSVARVLPSGLDRPWV